MAFGLHPLLEMEQMCKGIGYLKYNIVLVECSSDPQYFVLIDNFYFDIYFYLFQLLRKLKVPSSRKKTRCLGLSLN